MVLGCLTIGLKKATSTLELTHSSSQRGGELPAFPFSRTLSTSSSTAFFLKSRRKSDHLSSTGCVRSTSNNHSTVTLSIIHERKASIEGSEESSVFNRTKKKLSVAE